MFPAGLKNLRVIMPVRWTVGDDDDGAGQCSGHGGVDSDDVIYPKASSLLVKQHKRFTTSLLVAL